jgi:predicted enzyme related to lactoylglutathione lyase
MTRVLCVAITAVAAAGGAVLAQSKSQMPADVGAGRPAWFDISTTSVPKAREFYGALFGWTFTAVAGADQAVEINSRGVAIGTIRGAEGAISAFNGVVYIQVDDIRVASEKAKSLGATIVPGFPFNLPNARGAISLIVDPSGHPLGLYSRAPIPDKAP